ncbi:MAG: Ig-like domain-containing protein, partial [Lachnospiraceae bacterium]|nr:Ig-like domain-containing protein [Lachnospiraceae bacterium]
TAKCTVTGLGRVERLKIKASGLGSAKAAPDAAAEELTVTGLEKNKTFKLSPVIDPSKAYNKNVLYQSSDPGICTVTASGAVKRLKDGSADIYVTAADGGFTAVCHLR